MIFAGSRVFPPKSKPAHAASVSAQNACIDKAMATTKAWDPKRSGTTVHLDIVYLVLKEAGSDDYVRKQLP